MAVRAVIFVLCTIAVCGISGKSLPSFIKPCKRNDPKFNDCLKNLVQNIRPQVSKGIQEMHILPLDPLAIPTVTLNQNSGSVFFNALFTELKAYGAKNYEVQKIIFNMKNKVADIDIFIPTLKIESKYEINGKVLVLPIQGNGKFVGEFAGVQAKIKFGLNYTNKKSKTFMEIKENKVSLQFGGVKLHFSNLFNGNKELGDNTNRFINENWKELETEIKPLIEETVGHIVLGIFKPVFETFSMEELLPV